MRRFGAMPIVIGLTLWVGCGDPYPADRVTKVADDDPRMNGAMEKARSSVGEFITALKSPQAGQTEFTVKMAFSDGSNTEHMWLAPVTFDGETFHGPVSNDPASVGNVRMGQRAEVSPTKISDWMYLDQGKVVGGYTLRVLRDTLSPKERVEFDKSVQFRNE